jgi:tetratricopeptide (TPR) repeat protein
MALSDQVALGSAALIDAAFISDDYERAENLLTAAHDEAVRLGDDATRATVTCRLGMVMHYRALQDEITEQATVAEEALFHEALDVGRSLDDANVITEALFGLGIVHQVLRSDWPAAMPYFREALSLVDAGAGDLLTQAEVHRHMGFYYLVENVLPAKAVDHLETSLRLRERHGDQRRLPTAYLALGRAHIAAGRHDNGVHLLRQAAQTMRSEGFKPFWVELCEDVVRDAEAAGSSST